MPAGLDYEELGGMSDPSSGTAHRHGIFWSRE